MRTMLECQYCKRRFIKRLHHRCNTGFRKHKHKFEEVIVAPFTEWFKIIKAKKDITANVTYNDDRSSSDKLLQFVVHSSTYSIDFRK